jgi:hypothetical protein
MYLLLEANLLCKINIVGKTGGWQSILEKDNTKPTNFITPMRRCYFSKVIYLACDKKVIRVYMVDSHLQRMNEFGRKCFYHYIYN